MEDKIIEKLKDLGYKVNYLLKMSEDGDAEMKMYDYSAIVDGEIALDDSAIDTFYRWQHNNKIRVILFNIHNVEEIEGFLEELSYDGFKLINKDL